MYDSKMEASIVASLDTLAWVTWRVSHAVTSTGDSASALCVLAGEVSRLAVGHEFFQRLLAAQRQIPRYQGSPVGPVTYGEGGSPSGRGPPSATPPRPPAVGYVPPFPAHDPGG